MKDEEYLFRQDSKRGKNGFGAHGWSPSRRGGVRFPSDGLSRKEKKALNSEVKTYNLRRPMSWAQFKAMPINLQREYAAWLERTFLFDREMVKSLFGISNENGCWSRYRTGTLKFEPRRGRLRNATAVERASFERWLNNAEATQNDDLDAPDDENAKDVVSDTAEEAKPEARNDTECKDLIGKHTNPRWEEIQELPMRTGVIIGKNLVWEETTPARPPQPEVMRGDLTITCTPYELPNFISSLIGAERVTFRVMWGE